MTEMAMADSPQRTETTQWFFGGGVIAFALILQMLPLLLNRGGRGWSGLAYWLVQTPILLVALLAAYLLTKKLRLSVLHSLALTMAAAVVAGALAGMTSHFILLEFWGPKALPGPPGASPSPLRGVFFGSIAGLFTAGFWALGFVYPSALATQRTLELEKERLSLQRKAFQDQSALHQLRARLEPHFLLNTLNAISGLVTQDPKEARRLLATLGELLSDSVDDGDIRSLDKEVRWLRGYASLLETRFSGRLTFSWDIDESALTAQAPHLLIQPLVENSVAHGALHARADGWVVVKVEQAAGENGRSGLFMSVSNNGPQFDPNSVREGAFGITAVRKRLALWDDEASLEYVVTSDHTDARVWLPLRNEL